MRSHGSPVTSLMLNADDDYGSKNITEAPGKIAC